MSILDSIWVEKYRPKTLEEVILPDKYTEFFKECLIKREIPHLLFTGPPGSGKTSLARVLCETITEHELDLLILNGSDTRGIDTVRETITNFLKTTTFASNHKIVFIDEFDYMTLPAQASLRNIFETYSSNGRFVCTGNYRSKIEEALISRFSHFQFDTISRDNVLVFCKKILESENIEYLDDQILLLIDGYLPDVRKIINLLQENCTDGKLKNIDADKFRSDEKIVNDAIRRVCFKMGTSEEKPTINVAMKNIRDVTGGKEPDYFSIYESLYKLDIPAWAKISINKYANAHRGCALPQIHFDAMILEIISNGRSYIKLFS